MFEGLRVLLVEDEALVSMLVGDMLLDLGCEIVGPASSVRGALDMISSSSIDCAILDVNVAGNFVYPVADALRVRGCPFAFASGYGDEGVRPEDGDKLVLRKPFKLDDLSRVLTLLTCRPGRAETQNPSNA